VRRTQTSMEPFVVTSYDLEGGRVFSLRGELDASTCVTLVEHLTGVPGPLVVLDLHELTFMDSSGLGAIHRARQSALKEGGTLVVSRPNPMVARVLEITGLDTWIAEWDPKWADPSVAHVPATVSAGGVIHTGSSTPRTRIRPERPGRE
jgi:stage II sporulation protein AA (anti-sigma F factor antagonist)